MRSVPLIAALLAVVGLALATALWLAPVSGQRKAPTPQSDGPVEATEATPDVASPAESAPVERVELPLGAAEPSDPEEPDLEPSPAAERTGSIAGRLLLAGGPPGETIELHLEVTEERRPGAFLMWSLQVDSAPDGRFRVDGLPADWNGAVNLPWHYSAVTGEEDEKRSHFFTARAGDLGLAIEVERQPTLRGRVLRAAGGAPVVEASVGFMAHWNDVIHSTSAPTDADGRFRLPLRSGHMIQLELSCRTEQGEFVEAAWDAASFPPANAAGDVELGDLFLAPAQIASILVFGPYDLPFEGASVVERGTREPREVETDAEGRAELHLSDALEGFEVRARGYSLVELPRPAPGAQLVVRLTPACILSVEVVDAQARPWPHGLLRLKAGRPAFEGDRELPVDVGLENLETGRDHEGAYAVFKTGPEGRAELPGIVPGLGLELIAEDLVGTPGAQARIPGLAAGERRSLRLRLNTEPLRVSGRCIDASGNGISGAKVDLSVPRSGSIRVTTDENGSFASPLLLGERVRLGAYAEGYVDCKLEDVTLPADLSIVLERGRKLQVRLRDASGAPSGLGKLQMRDPANGTVWGVRRASTSPGAPATGPQTFAGVPLVGVELVHVWHLRTTVAPVPDHVEEFVWDLPSLGRLEVDVGPCAVGELESGYVLLEALDGRGAVQQELLPPGEASSFRFEPWPGRYRLRRVIHAFTADADGWRTPAGSRDVGEPVEVEVTVDRIAQAELEGAP